MKIKSMRSVLILLAACLVIAGTVSAETGVQAQYTFSPYEQNKGEACSGDPFPGQPGGTGIAIVEVSGHADTAFDGTPVEPASTGTYDGFPTLYYPASEGSHSIWITRDGYFSVHYEMPACPGKVSYVYYDMAAHLRPGMTAATTTTTLPVTTVPVTAAYDGQSGEYGALRDALGTRVPAQNPGSLSVSTDPEGAAIYIDGVQQGISPATIPGIAAGTHTLLLKRDGYQDLSLPIVISAGRTHTYSSALLKSGAAPVAAGTTTRKSSTPGAGAVVAACIAGLLLLCRKNPS